MAAHQCPATAVTAVTAVWPSVSETTSTWAVTTPVAFTEVELVVWVVAVPWAVQEVPALRRVSPGRTHLPLAATEEMVVRLVVLVAALARLLQQVLVQ
jgi:hypothetical protein